MWTTTTKPEKLYVGVVLQVVDSSSLITVEIPSGPEVSLRTRLEVQAWKMQDRTGVPKKIRIHSWLPVA